MNPSHYIKRKLLLLFQLRQFVKENSQKSPTMKWSKSIRSARNGFYSISSVIYDFEKNDKAYYLSDWQRLTKASKINSIRRIVLDDKLIFHHLNENNQQVVPIIALTINGVLYEKIRGDLRVLDGIADFKMLLRSFPQGVIIKPYTGGGGNHISKAVLKDNELIFSGYCKSEHEFEDKIVKGSRGFLMTKVITQNNYASNLYPYTLNTIRILTMIDPANNKPFVATAVQRVGTNNSKVVDNWTAGGISIKIEVETGVMSKGATSNLGKNGKLEWYDQHPDTKVKFSGVKIPNWEKIVNSVVKLSQEYHYLPYIGWDIVPLEDDFLILEGNTNSDVNLLQIHGGLLKDERVRRFYKKYNVI